ncbi:MAG: bifunctional hydroxymethylpyrimidine kinase/phosphomethylpyrimidine kinase [Desulfobacterales bacterium]|jgi:hydroxymethylpyrimidine/phosphomethylpyrimidine kinase
MQALSDESGTNRRYARVLAIAGSDSGGGAGIQADLKTFSALGCYGMSVVTALTAQNTTGVTGIHAVPPAFVVQQMAAVFSDIGADAVKIGMLYSAELIQAVADGLRRHEAANIVLDPVMVAQSGDKLLQDAAITALKDHLLPLATVLTPNLPEAAVLLGREVNGLDDMQAAAKSLAAFGSRSVLLKGGHAQGDDSSDVLFIADEDRCIVLEDRRVRTANTHGTGCTLSSAIAAYLAKGETIAAAVRNAKKYIAEAIRAGAPYRLGHGSGPVHHFYSFWS